MKRHLFIIYLYFVTGVVAWGQSTQQLRLQMDSINSLLKLAPSDVDLRLKKAALNVQLGQWEYAVEEYGRVLQADQKNLAALYYRAYANTHLRQYGLARYDYEQMLALVPRHFEGRLGLAVVLELMGHERDARDEFNRLVELHPDSATSYAARASFEAKRGQHDVALYDWEQAIALAPDNLQYAVSRVDLLLTMGRKRDARQHLETLIKRHLATRGELHEWLERCK